MLGGALDGNFRPQFPTFHVPGADVSVLVAGYDFSACASKDGSCRLFVIAWQDDLALELNAVADFDLAVDEPDNDPVAVTAHVESSAGLAIETNLPLSL